MGWDFMYPRGYHPRRPDKRHKRPKCLECRADIGTAKVNGHKVNLVYCQKHYCARMLPGGTICSQKNNGRSAYCDNHVRCQASGEEGRCWRTVQEGNPEKFKWCQDHGCTYPTCNARRTDPSNPNCPLHRCFKSSCDKPRQLDVASFFCEQHTCEAGTCTAEVEGAGDKGDPSRFCEHHRRCAAAVGCTRRCLAREDALGTGRFCAAHCCRADACDEERVPGSEGHCERHLCVEPGCLGGRQNTAGGGGGGGRFCGDHQCKAEGCVERRDARAPGAEHCALHLCLVEGCARPAAPGRTRCENHQYCAVEGCREWIYVAAGADGDVQYYSECETHHLPRCLATTITGTQCDNRVRPDDHESGAGRWCDDHACGLRSCPNPRPPESLQYCSAHRCGAGTCQDQVRRAMVLPASLLDAAAAAAAASSPMQTRLLFLLAAGGGGGAAGVAPGGGLPGASTGRFCAAHSCQGDGGRCGSEVVGAGGEYFETYGGRKGDRERGRGGRGARRGLVDEPARFCARHECSRSGCRAEATHWSRRGGSGRGGGGGGLCDRHYRKRKDGAVGGGVGGVGFGPPVGGMPVPMSMPMGMGMGMAFPPPFFGAPGYDSSESSSDSDDERGPRGLPFGGPFF